MFQFYKAPFIVFQSFKLLLALTVILLLCMPAKISRPNTPESLKPILEKAYRNRKLSQFSTVDTIASSFGKNVCKNRWQKHTDVDTGATKEDFMQIEHFLKLPPNSKLGNDLIVYAKCQMDVENKSKVSNPVEKFSNECLCKLRPVFVVLAGAACFSSCACIFHIGYCLLSKDWNLNFEHVMVTSLGTVMWLVVCCVATATQYADFFSYTPPNYPKTLAYYKQATTWNFALGFAFIYFIFLICEIIYINNVTSRKTREEQRSKDGNVEKLLPETAL